MGNRKNDLQQDRSEDIKDEFEDDPEKEHSEAEFSVRRVREQVTLYEGDGGPSTTGAGVSAFAAGSTALATGPSALTGGSR